MSKQKASVVIGLGYGDEGKGLTVNELCKGEKNAIVVRFSGGQQAGHTVHHRGIKHTFSNYGAGTLQNVPTYFSEHTTFYPPNMHREKKVLEEKGVTVEKVLLHPMARLTTPWDVHANTQDSANRKHGTCGQGVGKTMSRNEGPFKVRAIDLTHKDTLLLKLDKISNYYNLKMTSELLNDIQLFYQALNDSIWEVTGYDVLKSFEHIIFEGSQGIMLDMDHGVFPNVTYANTTSKNAMEICDKLDINKRGIYHVTRAYSTKHGAGHYLGEDIILGDTEHETNTFNAYQGEFKTSKMDYERLNFAIRVENLYSKDYQKVLLVTCCNQVSNEDKFDSQKVEGLFTKILYSHSVGGEFTFEQ